MAAINRSKEELSNLLKEVVTLYTLGGETWRASSFTRAITALRRIPDSTLSSDITKKELVKYADIGPSTADVILEYIRTGRIDTRMNLAKAAASKATQPSTEVSTISPVPSQQPIISPVPGKLTFTFTAPIEPTTSLVPDDKLEVMRLFQKIYGVGEKTAAKWYDRGWRTLDDLRSNITQLTHGQQLGLQYINDLQQRIPRDEIIQYEQMLPHIFPNTTYMITGSYRRGLPNSGDIDLLVQSESGVTIPGLVGQLAASGSLIGVLAEGPTKFMGIIYTQYDVVPTGPNSVAVTFKGTARRMDIRVIAKESWPFALLYFTGSATLNVQMRIRAIEKGWTLSEYGLIDAEGVSIHATSEEDIFRLLDMTPLTPIEREI